MKHTIYTLRSALSLGIFVGTAVFLGLTGCSQEEVAEPFEPRTSHADYIEGLKQMDLADAAMGRKWIDASEEVLAAPVKIDLPFREQLFFDPAEPDAGGYEFAGRRGRSIRIDIDFDQRAELRLFVDLFRVEDDGGELLHIASYNREENSLVFEPQRDNHYILRLQPELLRGGRYTLSIEENPVLAFPVEGKDMSDIHSFFGDPRDGGRRKHEGVDIFAARGTPVLSVSEGTVRRVGPRELGGKTVFVRDEKRGLNYYYAHLDEQYVKTGQTVSPGDPLGAVGNTGNAITTPPHLHFGIYEARWHALDPWVFLEPGSGAPAHPPVDEYSLENYMRTTREVSPDLPPGTVVRLVAAGTERLRVRVPGHQDYSQTLELAYHEVESMIRPLKTPELLETDPSIRMAENTLLYSSPSLHGEAVAKVSNTADLTLLGVNGSFYYVETAQGRRGWLRKA